LSKEQGAVNGLEPYEIETSVMRRRDFVKLVSSAAGPLTAHAQQPPMPVVGYLSTLSEAQVAAQVAAFRRGTETPVSRRDEAFFGETQERHAMPMDRSRSGRGEI
jgi:hypothetical protein